jgi:hypothetical protein
MAYHSLLDWRLAGDLVGLLEAKHFDATSWESTEASLASTFVAEFGGSVVPLDGGVVAVDLPAPRPLMIVCHPFESTDENRYPARLALAVGDAEMRGIAGGDRPIEFADSFNLVRRPGWIAADLFQFA